MDTLQSFAPLKRVCSKNSRRHTPWISEAILDQKIKQNVLLKDLEIPLISHCSRSIRMGLKLLSVKLILIICSPLYYIVRDVLRRQLIYGHVLILSLEGQNLIIQILIIKFLLMQLMTFSNMSLFHLNIIVLPVLHLFLLTVQLMPLHLMKFQFPLF